MGTQDEMQIKFAEYEIKYNMRPGSPEWERAWSKLASRLGTSIEKLRGWQYMGPDSSYNAHHFRLRAGVGDNNTGSNRWESIDAFDAKHDAGKASDDVLAALYLALPFVEDHEGSQVYKPGAVAKAVRTIRDAIAKAEGR